MARARALAAAAVALAAAAPGPPHAAAQTPASHSICPWRSEVHVLDAAAVEAVGGQVEYRWRAGSPIRIDGQCELVLQAPHGQVVLFTMTSLSLDEQLGGEQIELRDGADEDAPLLHGGQ